MPDPPPSPPTPYDDNADICLKSTVAAVDWNVLASVACSMYGATSSRWGNQISGGYNVVRFLHLGDPNHTVLVARVPYRPLEGWTSGYAKYIASKLSSEVATMRYMSAHTTIPVPRVIHYCVEANGEGAGSPYMIMTRVDGVPLSSVWDTMDDTKREAVLRMVVDILLELASHRFDKMGLLFQREGENTAEQEWYVAPMISSPDDTSVSKAIPDITFTSAIDFWLGYANATLENIRNANFGSSNKIHQYCRVWFMRSLIPALYDPSLDVTGFPLCSADFHSRNIMIADSDTLPRITAIIDWEFSGPRATSTLAQYPPFIVDHPLREDNPLRARNARDKATFDVLIREAEMKKDRSGTCPLSRAFANCQGVYLFEQAIQYPAMFPAVYPQLFAYIFGEKEGFSADYYWALMENGIMRQEARQFEKERTVWIEARKTLGKDVLPGDMNRMDFVTVLRKHIERFPEINLVREWLAMI